MLVTIHTGRYIPELKTNGPIFSPIEISEEVYNSLIRHNFHVEIYKTPEEIKMEQKKEEKKMIASLIPKRFAPETEETVKETTTVETVNEEKNKEEEKEVVETTTEEAQVEEPKTNLEDETALEVKFKKKNRR